MDAYVKAYEAVVPDAMVFTDATRVLLYTQVRTLQMNYDEMRSMARSLMIRFQNFNESLSKGDLSDSPWESSYISELGRRRATFETTLSCFLSLLRLNVGKDVASKFSAEVNRIFADG